PFLPGQATKKDDQPLVLKLGTLAFERSAAGQVIEFFQLHAQGEDEPRCVDSNLLRLPHFLRRCKMQRSSVIQVAALKDDFIQPFSITVVSVNDRRERSVRL